MTKGGPEWLSPVARGEQAGDMPSVSGMRLFCLAPAYQNQASKGCPILALAGSWAGRPSGLLAVLAGGLGGVLIRAPSNREARHPKQGDVPLGWIG